MGTSCSSVKDPAPLNQCGPIGDTTIIPDMCTFALEPLARPYGEQYCDQVGAAGEWEFDSLGNSCTYNDCKPYQARDTGCCKSCCGIAGAQVRCRRKAFTGDPVTCCMNNLACNPALPGTCFSDIGTDQGSTTQYYNTCADGSNGTPNYQDITSGPCQDTLFAYCAGLLPSDDPADTAWLGRWFEPTGKSGNTCVTALQYNLFTVDNTCPILSPPSGVCNTVPPAGSISASGYAWAQRLMGAAMAHYAANGFVIGSLAGTAGYNPWQDLIYNEVCCPYPGLCQSGLANACARFTAQRISYNPEIARFCGCHLPAGEYAADSSKFGITTECSPTCNRADVIPLVGVGAVPLTCTSSTCLINDLTVNLINAQIGGGINFAQVCGNCADGSCSCIVSNTTLDVVNSAIGGNLDVVTQNCGALNCEQANSTQIGPSTLLLPCTATENPLSAYEAAQAAATAQTARRSVILTVVVVLVLLFIVFVILYFFARRPRSPAGPSGDRRTEGKRTGTVARLRPSLEVAPSSRASEEVRPQPHPSTVLTRLPSNYGV